MQGCTVAYCLLFVTSRTWPWFEHKKCYIVLRQRNKLLMWKNILLQKLFCYNHNILYSESNRWGESIVNLYEWLVFAHERVDTCLVLSALVCCFCDIWKLLLNWLNVSKPLSTPQVYRICYNMKNVKDNKYWRKTIRME